MDAMVDYLDSYHGRDQIIRFCEYFPQFVSGCCTKLYAQKLLTFSNQMSTCRVILRLFDDLSMLRYNLYYGLGKEDGPDFKLRVFSVLANIFDQLYYPLEHLAWAEDAGLTSINRRINWWTASYMCWALSSYFTMCKSLKLAKNYHFQKTALKLYGSEIHSAGPRYKEFVKLSQLQFGEILSALRNLADLVEAIHYLPEGFLWAGHLREWQIGALGTVSCIISLYQSCSNS